MTYEPKLTGLVVLRFLKNILY